MDITLQNAEPELGRLAGLVDRFALEQSLPPNIARCLALALHEHVTNIHAYAFDVPGRHDIQVRLQAEAGWVQVEVVDDGRTFNPLERAEVDTSLPLDAKPLGGLGIHMIRKSMDVVHYRRVNNRNVLTLRKRIG